MIDEPQPTETSGIFRFRLKRRPVRIELVVVIVILAAVTFALWINNRRLESLLEQEQARVEGLADLVEDAGQGNISRAHFDAAREELEGVITQTEARVRNLEAAASARERVIAEASRSVVFIQGSYGFIDPDTGRPLRYFSGEGGRPLRLPDGMTMVTTAGEGRIVQIFYTGTAFVATEDGLVVTNRHVAYPWEFESNAAFTLSAGYEADRRRFIGYFPGHEQPVELEVIGASETADLAVARLLQPIDLPAPLTVAEMIPDPGDEVVVMGYPAGIEALLARADPKFADGLLSTGPVTFWQVGQALSENGYISPLATQGIVGQVTGSMIVYDADTASGGSGGPVIGLDGAVVAVNTAVLSQFSGSNLGVPAAEVRALLERVAIELAGESR